MWDNIKSDKIYIKCGILIVSTNNMWHNIIKEWHNTGFLQYNTPSLKSYGIFIFTIRIQTILYIYITQYIQKYKQTIYRMPLMLGEFSHVYIEYVLYVGRI